MKDEATPYVADLTRIGSEGSFPCPKCGNRISPDDETEEVYTIVETRVENDELAQLVLKCNQCGTKIRLTGFSSPSEETSASVMKYKRLQQKMVFKDQYEKLHPLYERLCQEVTFILDDEIRKSQIKIHGISYRIKSFDSICDKIGRKAVSIDPFKQVHDTAGARIICLYRSDLDAVGKLICKNFDVISSDTSRAGLETKFGYMADHYLVKLSTEYSGKRYDEIKSLQCEIQVRTILMDAWAAVSHHLDYKKETDVPSPLKKDFSAVSGLLYAADTHFELFRQGIEKATAKLLRSVKSDRFDLKQEINMDSLRAYLKWKLPHRETYSVSTYSDLVTDLKKIGYMKITQLDDALQASITIAEVVEKEEMHRRFYSDTGFVRICLMLYDKEYYQKMKQVHQKRNKDLFKLIGVHRSEVEKKDNVSSDH
jgi:putative GTP pyrophosphokinase